MTQIMLSVKPKWQYVKGEQGMKLKKNKCVVLVKTHGDKTYTIIGVFKNKKQANKFLNWLEPHNKSAYSISYTSFYVYEDPQAQPAEKE